MRTETPPAAEDFTPAAGWELGVRRTLPAAPGEVWRLLLTEWLPQWLEIESVPQMVGAPLRQAGAVRGRVLGCHVGRRVRVRWTPGALEQETVVQVTLQAGAAGTEIAVHQEHLPGPAEKQLMLERWTHALDALGTAPTPRV